MTRAPKVSKTKKYPFAARKLSLPVTLLVHLGEVQGIFCILTWIGQLTQTVFVKITIFGAWV